MHTPTDFMLKALELAERGRFTVSPNPLVGCVIVKNNSIIGGGFHQKAGMPHAEINALQEAGMNAIDATLFCTLEPCCHHGRTPPCTRAIIEAGIKKIFVATLDPNPLVSGKGIEELQSAGIEVEIGVCEKEASHLNEIYFHYITHKRPFVIAKWAMSLDGKTITHPHDTRNISSSKSLSVAHQLRRQVDAILIGSQTAIHDNPLLTARFDSSDESLSKQPLRIVLDSRGQLPLDLKLFDSSLPGKTIVVTTDAVDKNWYENLSRKNIEIWISPKDKKNRVHLPSLMDELGLKEISSILIEGGAHIHESFFSENLVNKIHVYLAPVIIASLEQKQSVHQVTFSKHHDDFHFTAQYRGKTHV